MMFEAWLHRHIQRHPVKLPAQEDRALFTAQVMERVRAVAQLVPARKSVTASWAQHLAWPRLSFAFAAAAGLLVVFVGLRATSHEQLARDILQRAEVLAKFSDGEPLLDNDVEALADEVDTGEQMMLAENQAPSEDASWIEQMSKVLGQVDESAAAVTPDSDSGWQEELETLDEAEFSASS